MKRERFESKRTDIYMPIMGMALLVMFGNYSNFQINDYLLIWTLILAWLAAIIVSKFNTYLEVQDKRTLINSGYRSIGKDTIDIFDIKYIYRYPNFILKWYGSRMVFYIQMPDGKLRQSALREVNYSNDTLRSFLKRIKQIKPNIELDPEYEKFLQEKLWLEDSSENTVASVEARLRERGEVWDQTREYIRKLLDIIRKKRTELEVLDA